MAEHTVKKQKTSNAICSTCGEKSETMQECVHSSHGSFNKAICEKCNQPDVSGHPHCQHCANMGKCGNCERETPHDLYCPICHKDLCDQCYDDATDSCTACAPTVFDQKHIQEDPSTCRCCLKLVYQTTECDACRFPACVRCFDSRSCVCVVCLGK